MEFMDSLDQKEIQSAGNKPLVGVFAVVVILLAGFIIYSQSNKAATEEPYPGSKPINAAEKFEQYLARVGWKEAGFASEAEAKQYEAISNKKDEPYSDSEAAFVRNLLSRPELRHYGVDALTRIKDKDEQLKFYGDVKGLFHEGDSNLDLRRVVVSWSRKKPRPAVDKMLKDPDQAFSSYVLPIVQQVDDPKGNAGM